MEIPERLKEIAAQAGQCISKFPPTIPFPANTMCPTATEGCNALLYQLMTVGGERWRRGEKKEDGR